jgi:hypothetical protein
LPPAAFPRENAAEHHQDEQGDNRYGYQAPRMLKTIEHLINPSSNDTLEAVS